MRLHRYLKLRRLRHEYAKLKAENDKTFWAIHDRLPGGAWKSRIRQTIDICRVDDSFQQEKALYRRIVALAGQACQ